jgi:hypothetical protein
VGHTDVAIGILPFPNFIDVIDSRIGFCDHGKVVCLDTIDGLYGKNFQRQLPGRYRTPLCPVSQFFARMKREGLGRGLRIAGHGEKMRKYYQD